MFYTLASMKEYYIEGTVSSIKGIVVQ